MKPIITPKRVRTFVHLLPGWLLLVVGCALLAAGVLVPVREQVASLEWQASVMRVQATQVDEQVNDYRRFASALAEDDPVLLERLAYHQLRMKRVDYEIVMAENDATRDNATGNQSGPQVVAVETLLHRPISRVGADVPEYVGADTRLTRLVRGPSHYLLLAAGAFSIIAGFLLPLDDGRECSISS